MLAAKKYKGADEQVTFLFKLKELYDADFSPSVTSAVAALDSSKGELEPARAFLEVGLQHPSLSYMSPQVFHIVSQVAVISYIFDAFPPPLACAPICHTSL
jgi:hypothetical protein